MDPFITYIGHAISIKKIDIFLDDAFFDVKHETHETQNYTKVKKLHQKSICINKIHQNVNGDPFKGPHQI